MSRYATVVPGVVGCGTYALVTLIEDEALADAHPVTATAASSRAPAMTSTDASFRMATAYCPAASGAVEPRGVNHDPAPRRQPPLSPAASAAIEHAAEQAERGRAEVHQRHVEALQGEAGSPVLPGSFAQLEEFELAPGVPAVGRVEGGSAGLGQRGRTGQVGVGLEPPCRLGDRHAGRVHADGAGQPGHADQCLQPDA